MSNAGGGCPLRRTLERLDGVERLLMRPQASALDVLVESLEASWRDICQVELEVRGGGGTPEWRAELEAVRGRVNRLSILLEQAQSMVGGSPRAQGSLYGGDGTWVVPGAGAGAVRRVNEEG